MVFSSHIFLYYFLPAVLFVYFVLLPKKIEYKNIFLLFASLFFYAWGEPIFVFVMILSIVTNYFFGLLMDKFRQVPMRVLVPMLAFNLSLIFLFKYLMFTLELVNEAINANIDVPIVHLPIGISFFTFQSISYVVDVYRRKGNVQKNPVNVGLYIALFPQLIAGPIVRYETISNFIEKRHVSIDDFTIGVERFICGLSKKVLLANNLAVIADHIFLIDYKSLTMPLAWLGMIAYTLQIYFDFSGYSDMAIGLGRMFGFRFLENFNYPYMSKSISEFWRRWHISLGSFFKDYVYIPLGGNRRGELRTYLNLFVVWSLTGIWHGANLTFLAWGLMYFLLIAIEKQTNFEKRCTNWFGHIYALLFVMFGWVIFRSDSLAGAVSYIEILLSPNKLQFTPLFIAYLSEYRYYLIFGFLFSIPYLPNLYRQYVKPHYLINSFFLTILLVTCAIYMDKGIYNPFIYFNF